MGAERIVALIVGAGAIVFGAMLLPYANAWHRKYPPKPLGFFTVSFGGGSPWLMRLLGMRALPVSLFILGAVSILFGLFHN